MTTILAIDTASPVFALALARDGQWVASSEEDAAQEHTRLLLPAIERLLGAPDAPLDGIVAVRGPGSYAGLRVGLATARGLALARGIPLRGIPTLAAVALASGRAEVTAIHPAGRGEFASQRFRAGEAVGPMKAARAEDLYDTELAGEGAGALGGLEIGPGARCRAALQAALEGFARAGENVEALYLREPNITLPRRPAAAPGR